MTADYRAAASILVLVIGLLVSGGVWHALNHRRRGETLWIVYIGGLVTAAAGAKIAFFIGEGGKYWGQSLPMLTGKSILGGLLGGYLGVELTKRALGLRRVTGDEFAIIVAVALTFGRIGCSLRGCCPGAVCEPAWWAMLDSDGISRWPSQPVELLFNLTLLGVLLGFRAKRLFSGNHFHIYLIAYGLFRFMHEFARDNHRWGEYLGGYHLLALAVAGVGGAGFWRRSSRQDADTAPGSG